MTVPLTGSDHVVAALDAAGGEAPRAALLAALSERFETRRLAGQAIGMAALLQRVDAVIQPNGPLADVGLLDGEGDDGWAIRNYLDFNPSKDKVLETRQRNAERQQRWRDKGTEGQSHNAVTRPVSNGVSNDAPARPGPTPPQTA